jgi:anti-sigma B factor antagonist
MHADLRIRRSDDHTVVIMPAELDATNSDDVRQRLLALLNDGAGPVVIDLTGTTFCDSSALKALLRAQTRGSAADRRLHAAVRPGGAVRRIFELVSMARVIPVHDDVDAAIAAATGVPAPRSEPQTSL